jgi:hypothetical protein
MKRTKEQDAARKRAERAANPELHRERDRKRNQDGPYSTWDERTKNVHRACVKRWRAAHPDKMKEASAKSNAARREKYKTDESYREARKAESRGIMPEIQRKRRARLKAEVFNHYGRICACCGEREDLFLTLGHVNGDGAQHRRSLGMGRSGSGATLWLDTIRRGFPKDLRVECYNCNCGAFRNGGVCPHKTAKITSDEHPTPTHES